MKKSKWGIEATAEEAEPPLLPLAKKAKHDGQCLPELDAENINPRTEKVNGNICGDCIPKIGTAFWDDACDSIAVQDTLRGTPKQVSLPETSSDKRRSLKLVWCLFLEAYTAKRSPLSREFCTEAFVPCGLSCHTRVK